MLITENTAFAQGYALAKGEADGQETAAAAGRMVARLFGTHRTVDPDRQDMQARLAAAAEFIRVLDQGNNDLVAALEKAVAAGAALAADNQALRDLLARQQAFMAEREVLIAEQEQKLSAAHYRIRALVRALPPLEDDVDL